METINGRTLYTMEELNEVNLDKEIEMENKKQEQLLELYFKRLWMIKSTEDYLRANWESVMEGHYDGQDPTEISCRFKSEKSEDKTHSITSIKAFDTKTRKGKKINVLKMITFLAEVEEIRELVYNNTWGIVVKEPKKTNYPEKVCLNTIKEIVMEGIACLKGKEKEIALMYLDSAPSNSVAAQIWNLIPSVTMDTVPTNSVPKASGVYEAMMSRMTNDVSDVEEIPEEDKDFWRDLYSTRKHLTYGKEFKVVA